jgi:hypothetical protein
MNAEGWFPDPAQPGRLRYFDGTHWTDQYAEHTPAAPTGLPVGDSEPGQPLPSPSSPAPTATRESTGGLTILGKHFSANTVVSVVVAVAVAIVAFAVWALASNAEDGQSNLIPAHKTLVYNLAAEGDCASLQVSFDNAYEKRGPGGTEKHKRNLALMDYADDAMAQIGCHD